MEHDAPLSSLLEAVAAGEADAFARLHREIRTTVLSTIQRILRDPWQSEEVAQEVFLEIWQKADQFEASRGSAQTWILTLAGRRAIDRVRSAQSARDRDVRSASRNTERPRDHVVELVESRISAAELHHALARLTPLQREAVITTYLRGHTAAEAAGHLGTSETAMRTRMRDGLIGLRRIIEPMDRAA